MEHDHEAIWLQPWCAWCEKHRNPETGRLWCQDNAWGECDECGNKPVRYVIERSAQ